MHGYPQEARHLIQTMRDAQRIVETHTSKAVRKAAADLRDKAFAKWVWG